MKKNLLLRRTIYGGLLSILLFFLWDPYDFFFKGNKYIGGHPLPTIIAKGMFQDFEKAYSINSQWADSTLKIPLKTLHEMGDNLFTRFGDATSQGVAFHYVLRDEGGKKYFSYVVSAATLLTKDPPVFPTIKGNNKSYFWLKENGGIEPITHKEMDVLKAAYLQQIKVKDTYPKDSVIHIKDFEHPTFSFFSGKSLKAFFTQNISGRNIQHLDLHIFNGAVHNEDVVLSSGHKDTLDVQVPILVFADNQKGTIYMDGGAFSDTQPYRNRALDVGRLCPPECNKM
ncbi:MAG: hypothetical protein JJ975_09640 [Bacteroidia bacterium]|nr:hypothetical protein [Bacteroidia bacterium]